MIIKWIGALVLIIIFLIAGILTILLVENIRYIFLFKKNTTADKPLQHNRNFTKENLGRGSRPNRGGDRFNLIF